MSDDGVGVGLADHVRLDELLGLEELDGHDAPVVGIRHPVCVLPQGLPFAVVDHDADIQRGFTGLRNA